MKIALNGRRLNCYSESELLATCGWTTLAATLRAEGFVLRPVRAPRSLKHDRLHLRLTWTRRDGALTETIRLSAVL
ncbi:MAG TPA: hypothetical protein PLO69_11195 [Gammaproteobacteria bacterium]|nr:hypothetical protein [Gammaproteobacteria bacterium]